MGRWAQSEGELLARAELGEIVGGGWIVLARSRENMRLKVPRYPFEWPTREAALAEAERLSSLFPSKGFFVFALMDGVYSQKSAAIDSREAG